MRKVQIVLRNALNKALSMSVKAKIVSGLVAATVVVGGVTGIVAYNKHLEEKKEVKVTQEKVDNDKNVLTDSKQDKDKDNKEEIKETDKDAVSSEVLNEGNQETVTESKSENSTNSNSSSNSSSNSNNNSSNSNDSSSNNGSSSNNDSSNSNSDHESNNGDTNTENTSPTYPKGFNSSATEWFNQDMINFSITQLSDGETYYNLLKNYVNNGASVPSGVSQGITETTGEVRTETTIYQYKEQYSRQDTINLFYGSGVFTYLACDSDGSCTNYMTVYNNGDGTVTLTLYHLCVKWK